MLRDDLLAFSLGEAAFDYAQRLNTEQPDNPAVMALLGETAWLYDRTKVKAMKHHWMDRMDVLQRGIDITRKCMREHPDYGPCYRSFTLCACKAADTQYYAYWWRPIGDFRNYNRVANRARKAVELSPDSELLQAFSGLTGRCAMTCGPWSPYWLVAKWYGVPKRAEMLERALALHEHTIRMDPDSLEAHARTALLLKEMGRTEEARRMYMKVRDEMVPREPHEDIWQTVAHTDLCGKFEQPNWNVPFGK